MMAGLDGIRRELGASLDALEADNAFLCEGDVFTPGLIEAYVRYKREEEVDAAPGPPCNSSTHVRNVPPLPFCRRRVHICIRHALLCVLGVRRGAG
jgi:hypothetical protein